MPITGVDALAVTGIQRFAIDGNFAPGIAIPIQI
jgi:hypothetical protein